MVSALYHNIIYCVFVQCSKWMLRMKMNVVVVSLVSWLIQKPLQ